MPEPMYRDKLAYLKRYGYITQTGHHTSLTPKGGYALSEAKIWNLTIPTPQKWNHKWYLVAFDIPNDKRKRRDSFRLRLKELGLKRYQNSVWIYPHPLKDTVKTIANFYALSKCVSFIVAEEISEEDALHKYFKLSL